MRKNAAKRHCLCAESGTERHRLCVNKWLCSQDFVDKFAGGMELFCRSGSAVRQREQELYREDVRLARLQYQAMRPFLDMSLRIDQ